MTLKEYIFYSPKVDGEVYFAFRESDGAIVKFEIKADLTVSQFEFLVLNFPFHEIDMQRLTTGKNNKCTIKEIEPDLSFQRFWNEYGNKKGKRKMTENTWMRLSKADKLRVFSHIQKYKNQCKLDNVQMAYPSTYLNQEYYKN